MSMNRLAIACACVLLGTLVPQPAHGSRTILSPGSPYIVDAWDIKDGLPDSAILSVVQTHEGYLWLGTLNGLVRFDGVKFTLFVEANTPGLNSSRIVYLFEDSRSNLWVGTEGAGVAMIQADGRVRSFDLGRGSRDGRLVSACEVSPGDVWLLTQNGLLGHSHSDRLDVSQVPGGKWLLPGSPGQLLVGAPEGLFARQETTNGMAIFLQVAGVASRMDYLLSSRGGGYWRLADGRIQKWKNNALERDLGSYPWGDTPVSAACEDSHGNLIVGTLGSGVYWFDGEGHAARPTLSYSSILSLAVDREGNLWIGTNGGGLDRVKRSAFTVLAGSEGKVVQSVSDDHQGGLWIAYNGNRVDHVRQGKDEPFSLVQDPQLAQSAYAKAVFVDRDQQVWVGMQIPFGSGLFRLQDGTFRDVGRVVAPYQTVSVIYQDRAGALWVGTQTGAARSDAGGLALITTEQGLPSNEIRAIRDDSRRNIWIATGGGLARLHEQQVTVFHKKDGLPSDDLSCLYVDDADVLWVGTRGSGLARFDGKKWTQFTMVEGLSGNSIGYLIEDGRGNLWMGSNAGLIRADKKSLNDFADGTGKSVVCRTYVEADGLPSRQCTQGSQPAASRSADGALWFPTTWGLVSLKPEALSKNEYLPPVIIESVVVEGEPHASVQLRPRPPAVVDVRPGREHLEIRYTSLNLGAADRSRFRYRLEPHDKEWTEDDSNARVARYNRLPPGRYRFEVMAANEDGMWNPVAAAQAIYVQPPFWKTAWFITVASLTLLGLIVSIVHYFSTQKLHRQLAILRQQEELERERGRIARDLHDQLGANLMQVALLGDLAAGDKDLPQEVESHAKQISQTARETTKALDEIVWAVNPSNDTLDGLITYICKYAQEYFQLAGLRYRLDVPAELPKRALPPEVRHNVFLAAKEAINNIVKHAQASAAWIRLRLEPDRFTLEIEDNGRGLAGATEGTGRNGLRNMRKRLEDIGGIFTIAPAAEHGAIVRLTVPVRNP